MIKIIYKFDEQSKAITASAGIEAELPSTLSLKELDDLTEEIRVRSEKLTRDAVEFSSALTRKYKRGL